MLTALANSNGDAKAAGLTDIAWLDGCDNMSVLGRICATWSGYLNSGYFNSWAIVPRNTSAAQGSTIIATAAVFAFLGPCCLVQARSSLEMTKLPNGNHCSSAISPKLADARGLPRARCNYTLLINAERSPVEIRANPGCTCVLRAADM